MEVKKDGKNHIFLTAESFVPKNLWSELPSVILKAELWSLNFHPIINQKLYLQLEMLFLKNFQIEMQIMF